MKYSTVTIFLGTRQDTNTILPCMSLILTFKAVKKVTLFYYNAFFLHDPCYQSKEKYLAMLSFLLCVEFSVSIKKKQKKNRNTAVYTYRKFWYKVTLFFVKESENQNLYPMRKKKFFLRKNLLILHSSTAIYAYFYACLLNHQVSSNLVSAVHHLWLIK